MVDDNVMKELDVMVTSPTPVKTSSGSDPVNDSIFDGAIIQILPDGRVEAIIDKLNSDGDEVSIRTSQKKVAAWIFNDVGAAVMDEASKIRPFQG